jgi:Arc/MetJ family transcription regulator
MRLVMLFNGELARLDREVPEVGKALRATVGERLERDKDNAPSLS